MICFNFTVPIKTQNTSNLRENYFAKAKRIAKERRAVYLLYPRVKLPVLIGVKLTRISPGQLDEHDNLRNALKGVCDAVAQRLGIDDASPFVRWSYAQELGPAAVRVEVTVDGGEKLTVPA